MTCISALPTPIVWASDKMILWTPEKYGQPHAFDVRKSGKEGNYRPDGRILPIDSLPFGALRWVANPPEGRSAPAGRLPLYLASFSKNIQTGLLWETAL